MGLFDFIRNIGKSVDDGEEAKSIEANIRSALGGKVENLTVAYNDGAVSLGGVVDTVATKQKAVLLAGNIKGVESVNDDHISVKPPEPEAPPEPQFTFYTIERGDSLSKIAKEFYGDAMKYPVLFEANREVIENPDLIYPGQRIRVPLKADSESA